MTGFGAASLQDGCTSVFVELKTVNNRFFKLSLRLSDGYSALEAKIESVLRSVIERGSVSAIVRIRKDSTVADYRISETVLQSYFEQLLDIADKLGHSEHVPRLERLVTLPGVIETKTGDDILSESQLEEQWQLVENTIRQALDALQSMRRTEGAAMRQDLQTNLSALQTLVGNVEEAAVHVAPLYRKRLKERIETLLSEQTAEFVRGKDEVDVLREVALYADKCDISEEIVRFKSHLVQFAAFLDAKESTGRKLDFLTQELLRETNTIGSKANDAQITKQVVEMKNIIEKIREMVQNIE